MILIADSGSTKTSWRIIDQGKLVRGVETKGLNPYYLNFEEIRDIIHQNLLTQLEEEQSYISHIYFYGSGCSSDGNKRTITNALNFSFPDSSVIVEHDLLASARALCGSKAGIACILGTGSNSCEYDGKEITRNIPSLGYVMGDEGSGSHLGKLLLSDFLRGVMPDEIRDLLQVKFNLTKDLILEKVYREPNGSRYLASFVPFIRENIEDDYVSQLVKSSFTEFFEKYLVLYKGIHIHPVNFTGSVAYYLKGPLADFSEKYGINLGKVVSNPIEGLVKYHIETAETNK